MSPYDVFELQKTIALEFWLDPEGVCHKFKGSLADADEVVSFHYEIAHHLYPELEHPEDFCYHRGWIAIGGFTGYRLKYEPTQAQINTLVDLGFSQIRNEAGHLFKF